MSGRGDAQLEMGWGRGGGNRGEAIEGRGEGHGYANYTIDEDPATISPALTEMRMKLRMRILVLRRPSRRWNPGRGDTMGSKRRRAAGCPPDEPDLQICTDQATR